MNKSESIKEIAIAMNTAQAEITAAKKDSKNPFFKSSYADLGSVIKAVKEGMYKNGLSYMQAPEVSENHIGVTTIIMHISGEWIESSLYLPVTKQDPQAAGSAITYARRYALQSLMGLPSADDDAEFAMTRITGSNTISGKPVDSAKVGKATKYFEDQINADQEEHITADHLSVGYNKLTPDEQIAVNENLKKIKFENRQMNTILKDFLNYNGGQ